LLVKQSITTNMHRTNPNLFFQSEYEVDLIILFLAFYSCEFFLVKEIFLNLNIKFLLC
jgi:hypothetical protein